MKEIGLQTNQSALALILMCEISKGKKVKGGG